LIEWLASDGARSPTASLSMALLGEDAVTAFLAESILFFEVLLPTIKANFYPLSDALSCGGQL